MVHWKSRHVDFRLYTKRNWGAIAQGTDTKNLEWKRVLHRAQEGDGCQISHEGVASEYIVLRKDVMQYTIQVKETFPDGEVYTSVYEVYRHDQSMMEGDKGPPVRVNVPNLEDCPSFN